MNETSIDFITRSTMFISTSFFYLTIIFAFGGPLNMPIAYMLVTFLYLFFFVISASYE